MKLLHFILYIVFLEWNLIPTLNCRHSDSPTEALNPSNNLQVFNWPSNDAHPPTERVHNVTSFVNPVKCHN